jgi:hypothetical protein
VKAGGKQSCAFTLASLLTYSPTLKMETYSSEPLVDFQRTIQRCIPEDKLFSEILVCEVLKFILKISYLLAEIIS